MKLRAYCFINMYLSSIQQGIQSAHILSDMMVKYLPDANMNKFQVFTTWASVHKTIIVLNGGFSSNLRSLQNMFSEEDNPYPWASFNEAEDALDNAITGIGIILPEHIFDPDSSNIPVEMRSPWERKIVSELQQYKLAK